MASRAFVSTVVLSLTACLLAHSRAAYESAGCSDQGCGIPCYMRPAADNCHYKPHSPCSNEGYDLDLENVILALNSSLHRLENKLVQKRVIPAGETCEPLDPITNGGVIYSDLLLSPGVIAHYVCQDGYVLHGHDLRVCAPDGGWINSEKGIPVCRDSLVRCEPLVPIPNGHIRYESVDRTTMQPGDVVTYSCDAPYVLEGESSRICISNGTWSGEEPLCSLPEGTLAGEVKQIKGKYNIALIAGASAGGVGGLLFFVIITMTVCYICRKYKKNKKQSHDMRAYTGYSRFRNSTSDADGRTIMLQTSLLEEEESVNDVKLKPMAAATKLGARSDKIETLRPEEQ